MVVSVSSAVFSKSVFSNVVLIEYKSKTLPGTYRLDRVIAIEIDEIYKQISTCTVVYKLTKPITDANKISVSDAVTKETQVPVQRLVLILPVLCL